MRKAIPFFGLIILFCFFICCKTETPSKEEMLPEEEKELKSLWDYCKKSNTDYFYLESDNNIYKPFFCNDNTINICVPNGIDLSNLIFCYPSDIIVENLEGNYPDYSDFANPNTFSIRTSNGEEKTFAIVLHDLPVLTIDTPDGKPILSKEERTENCLLKIYDSNDCCEDLGTAGIKVRGNSTALLPKKPYNVKLDTKKSLLGMQKSKKWVLLANAYYDRTQLHNATAFEIARLTDYPWVQEGRFVELFLNGEHKGLYYLCEKIEVEKGRINIDELTPEDIDDEKITGGYMFESSLGEMEEGTYYFTTDYFNVTGSPEQELFWTLKTPDENVPDDQLNYIKNHMNLMESAVAEIGNITIMNDYKNYLDIETAINWWMVEELCINEESSRTKNCYLYKKRGDDKIYFGPCWDFDAWSFGMAGTKCWYPLKFGYFWNKLFQDQFFVNRVKEKWSNYKSVWYEEIPSFIEQQYQLIHKSAERNEVMWPEWIHYDSNKSYKQVVDDMECAFYSQIEWMDEKINEM